MSVKHFRIIALQSVIALFVFLSFVYYFIKYDSERLQNQINNMGQTLSFAIEEDVNISKSVLASFAYNYEIDPDLDVAKFEILAKHYLKVNPEIIYIQRKDKETTTVMVYPDTYRYTLGATLMGRPEVEEAVIKAIKDKIVTANSPFILKDTDDLLGLVIRYPLYHDETFKGFFVVVMNVENFLEGIIDAEMIKDYNISFFDDNEKLFWGYDGEHKGHVFIKNIAILDNFWTIQLSMKSNMMASTVRFVMGTSFLFLLVVGLLVAMQIRLVKKDQNIQHLRSSKNELEKVKESHTLALDSANDALWEWNIITGEIYTSDKWEEINGYEKVGQGVDAILQKDSIHPDDYEQSVLALEACLSGEKHTFDIEYRTKNPLGNYNLIQNRGKIYIDDRGYAKILAGSISNITERKQTEKKLAESEALLSRSQEIAHVGSWNLDLTTDKLYWSDETYRIFGCEPQAFIATYETFLEYICPDDRAAVHEAYYRSVREKSQGYEIEHQILRQSTGELRYVYERCVHVRDDAGDIIQSIGMIQDITERKVAETEQRKLLEQVQRDRRALVSTLEDQQQAEKQLRESEGRIRLATEQSNVAIWEYDFNTNTMSRSANYDQLFGITRQERWDITKFQYATHPDDREYSNQFIQKSVAPDGSDDYAYDFRVVLSDATIRWLSVNGRVIERDENKQGIRVRGTITDITQRKQVEAELVKAKEAAEAANVAKSRFLANMSHEIRTPMNGFMGMIQLMQTTELTVEQQNFMRIAKLSTDRLLTVVNDILEYSRIEAGKIQFEKTKFSLGKMISDTIDLFKVSTENTDLLIDASIGKNVPDSLVGDSFRLNQVMSNLIGNAIKFTRKGSINIDVKCIKILGNKQIMLEFAVKDTGIGIPRDRIDILFSSFSQVDDSTTRVYGGSGLGLSICKGLVEKMGGEIWVESIEGEGSTFYFTCVLEKADE